MDHNRIVMAVSQLLSMLSLNNVTISSIVVGPDTHPYSRKDKWMAYAICDDGKPFIYAVYFDEFFMEADAY